MTTRTLTRLLSFFFLTAAPLVRGENFEQEFLHFARQSEHQFTHFSDANEKAFARDFLAQWESFNEALVEPLPRLPKPVLQPAVASLPVTHSRGTDQATTTTATPLRLPEASGGFYGHALLTPPLHDLPSLTGTEPEQLLGFRQHALKARDFNELIQLLDFMRQRFQADSYATLALAQHLCRAYFPGNNPAIACAWVLGQTQGFDLRLGRRQQTLLLLAASGQEWYEHPFFLLGTRRFYVLNPHDYRRSSGDTRLQTTAHGDASRDTRVSLSRSFTPALRHMTTVRRHDQTLRLDEDFVAWLYRLPLLTVSDYLNDPIPEYLRDQLAPHFLSTRQKPAHTRLADTLTSLQAWPYMIDQAQFGREKPMTFSEALFFPYTDCEDRVYALAALGRAFLALEIAALRFPDHLSGAARLDNHWIEADPTYQGAAPGMRQPAYRDVEPEWLYP